MNNSYGNYGGNAEEPQKAPNIFQQFGLSFIPPQYHRLAKVKTGSMIGFVTLLALVATIISAISFAVSFAALDIKGWVNELPDFEIKNGRLYLEEEFLYDEDEIFVYVTEDISDFSYDDADMLMDEGYTDILLVGRDGLSLMQNGEYQQFDFSTATMDISRDMIVDTLVPMIMVFIVVGYIIFFVGRVLWYFLCAAIYLVFGLIIASVMKKQVSAGALYRAAVYSKVLMFVVATVVSLIPLESLSIPFYIRVAITLVFMGFAIAKLPDQTQWHQA